jgi:hypothetical protein
MLPGQLRAQEPQAAERLSPEREASLRSAYPRQWDITTIPAGSALALLKSRYERRLPLLAAARDLEDRSPLPPWFRAYVRHNFPGLPSEGAYQYPRVTAQMLEWMLAHPNLTAPPPTAGAGQSMTVAPSRVAVVGTNINLTNLDEINSESFIAVDYNNPQFLIAGSNNINGSGRQRMFHSSDGGVTWNKTELPLAPGSAFDSDPAVAWSADGTAWAATLGIDNLATSVEVQVFKSTDRGATWSFVNTVSTGGNNDKELMWVDADTGSPNKGNIYVAWDVPGAGMRFARSTDAGATWSPVMSLSSDGAIGADLTTGPAGELYVAWPDTRSRKISVRKSTDGGASFNPTTTITTTNDSYEISIPAMCERRALIYVTIRADRSTGPRRGWVYAAWTDRNGADPDPDCGGTNAAANSNVYFSRSTDGGATWSAPRIVHTDQPKTDQFNQWMDVDPDDGTIHVIFYDTRDDPSRKGTNLYHVASHDGGDSWTDEAAITTMQSDETTAGTDANQYGDYNGLAVYRGAAFPVWTDRRAGVPGNREQIFSTRVNH